MHDAWAQWLTGWQVLWSQRLVIGWLAGLGWGMAGWWALVTKRLGWPTFTAWGLGWPLLGLLAVGVSLFPAPLRTLSGGLLWASGLIFAGRWLWRSARRIPWPGWGLLLWQGGIALPWNLAAWHQLLVPPYTDPADHYAMIAGSFAQQAFQGGPVALARVLRGETFYHLGFHGLFGWVTWQQGLPDPLALGVIATFFPVLILPLSLYGLAEAQGSRPLTAAGIGWAAGMAWAMPLYSLNWGKYPALLALAAAPAVLGIALSPHPPRFASSRGEALLRLGLTGVAWLVLFWAHARVGSLTLALALGMVIWRRLPPLVQRALLPLGLIGLSVGGITLAQRGPYWRFYLPWAAWAIPASGALLAWRTRHRGPLWGGLGALGVLIGAAWIPLPNDVLRGGFWLDRPLFEMLVPLPLSWLLGFGVEALLALPALSRRRPSSLTLWAIGLAAVAGAGRLSWQHTYRPLPAVVYVQEDDRVALAFLQRWASQSDIALIHTLPQGAPTDGGAWVMPLTGMAVQRWPHPDWWEADLLRGLCARRRTVWVYVDLDPPGFALPPERPYLTLKVLLPTVHVYQVACETWVMPP